MITLRRRGSALSHLLRETTQQTQRARRISAGICACVIFAPSALDIDDCEPNKCSTALKMITRSGSRHAVARHDGSASIIHILIIMDLFSRHLRAVLARNHSRTSALPARAARKEYNSLNLYYSPSVGRMCSGSSGGPYSHESSRAAAMFWRIIVPKHTIRNQSRFLAPAMCCCSS